MNYEIYASLLKMNDTFRVPAKEVPLTVDFSAPELSELRERFDLPAIAGEGDSFARAMKVMDWLTTHLRHNGSFNFPDGHLALEVFSFAFDHQDKGVNCTTLARTLASCLLSLGIPARPVGIYPLAPYDGDNHFVTEMWCEERDKWILLDPTVNTCVLNKAGEPLSCLETRALLADQEEVRFSEGLRYNMAPHNPQKHRDYLAKDLFYFQFPRVSAYDTSRSSWRILAPRGFDVKRREILNILWRIHQYGESDWMRQWLDSTRHSAFRYISPADAYRRP